MHDDEDLGYCRSVEDGMDGHVNHTATCLNAGNSAVSGPECISRGQDGRTIKAEREAAADKHRFTPPEYRNPSTGPASSIDVSGVQGEVIALRGRPRGAGDEAWSTWETYWTEPTAPRNSLLYHHQRQHRRPRDMSADEAAAIVAEFTGRVPHYEFKIVVALVVVVEDIVA